MTEKTFSKLAYPLLAFLSNKLVGMKKTRIVIDLPQGRWVFKTRAYLASEKGVVSIKQLEAEKQLIKAIKSVHLQLNETLKRNVSVLTKEYTTNIPITRTTSANGGEFFKLVPLNDLEKQYGRKEIKKIVKRMGYVCDFANNRIVKIMEYAKTNES